MNNANHSSLRNTAKDFSQRSPPSTYQPHSTELNLVIRWELGCVGTSHNVLPLFFQGNGNNNNYSFCNKDYYYWNNNDIDCKSVYLIKTLLFICNLLTKKLNENLTSFFWLSNPGSLPLTLCKLLLPPKEVHVHFGNFTVWDYNYFCSFCRLIN